MSEKTTRLKNTLCVHAGQQIGAFGGLNTPVYTSTSFGYLDTEDRLYPRYFNVPNQKAVFEKIARLENAESGIVFSSGMAAVSTTLLSFLNKGDHVVFQNGLYGGTLHFVSSEFDRFGIEYTILKNNDVESFRNAIQKNTKVIYVESPSNPLLTIIDLVAVSELCRKHQCISIIDNTFASPINQNPINLGIDIVLHSATKYLGGHSDICAGVVVSYKKYIDRIMDVTMNFGGSLNALMCYLLERSIKTMGLRVEKQNQNSMQIAEFLQSESNIDKVYYPGLKSHQNHDLAKKQMTGFGGIVSFEIKNQDTTVFQKKLRLITPAMSLGGVESIICAPITTSHRLVTKQQREEEGIKDNLLRLSVGIEEVADIIEDLKGALRGSE